MPATTVKICCGKGKFEISLLYIHLFGEELKSIKLEKKALFFFSPEHGEIFRSPTPASHLPLAN